MEDWAEIALEALRCSRVEWGGITELARRHGVSRMFVYGLIASLTCFFSPRRPDAEPPAKLESKRFAELLAVALRVFCDGSVGGISQALKVAGLSASSVGAVSALLAEVAAATGIDLRGLQLELVVLADEVFARGRPILVVMDARTHCVLLARLADDRKGCTWKDCFASLQEQGARIAGVVKDKGSGLHKGARDMLVYSINHNVATRGRYKGTSAWQRLTGRPESSGVVDQLLQLRDAKRMERSGEAAPSMQAAVEVQPPLGKVA